MGLVLCKGEFITTSSENCTLFLPLLLGLSPVLEVVRMLVGVGVSFLPLSCCSRRGA